jgi:hypothetical protein
MGDMCIVVVTFHCADFPVSSADDLTKAGHLELASDSTTLSAGGMLHVYEASPQNTVALTLIAAMFGATIGMFGLLAFQRHSQSSSFDPVSQDSIHEMTDGRTWSDVKVSSM